MKYITVKIVKFGVNNKAGMDPDDNFSVLLDDVDT
jgi:hypothetical protein